MRQNRTENERENNPLPRTMTTVTVTTATRTTTHPHTYRQNRRKIERMRAFEQHERNVRSYFYCILWLFALFKKMIRRYTYSALTLNSFSRSNSLEIYFGMRCRSECDVRACVCAYERTRWRKGSNGKHKMMAIKRIYLLHSGHERRNSNKNKIVKAETKWV